MTGLYLSILFLALLIVITGYLFKDKNHKIREYKTLDKVGMVLNVVLSLLYLPLSSFSMLMFMASEGTIQAKNKIYINLINIFCNVTISIPLLCVISIALSVLLRRKGKRITSFLIQFLPIIIFGLNIFFYRSLNQSLNNGMLFIIKAINTGVNLNLKRIKNDLG